MSEPTLIDVMLQISRDMADETRVAEIRAERDAALDVLRTIANYRADQHHFTPHLTSITPFEHMRNLARDAVTKPIT